MEFCDWIQDELSGSITDDQYEEIINRIRNSPLCEINGCPTDEDCPIFSISAHYLINKLKSKRDLDLLLNIYKEFRKRNVSFDGIGFENDTLLHIAMTFGKHNLEIVKFLVDNGVPIDEGYEGETALDEAIDNGRFDIAAYLINNGATYTDDQYNAVPEFFYKEPECE